MISYTGIRQQFLRNIGSDNSTDTGILADFANNLNQRYQMILGRFKNYTTQETAQSTTVAQQQYYHYPVNLRRIEGVVVTIGSVNYPCTVVNSQYQWDWLNSLQVQPTAIPQFIFPRKSDFGIYPIPQSGYTITFNYHPRDRALQIDDYTTGSVTVTNGSVTVTGSGTTFASYMIGCWIQITSTTTTGHSYWYKISNVVSVTELTLETSYEGTTGSSLSYKIGQLPNIPEEGHIILVDGATADFYAGVRHDVNTSTWFNNKFWTGDGQNSNRNIGDSTITGGLIGLLNQYTDRNDERIVEREKKVYPFFYQNWSSSIGGS